MGRSTGRHPARVRRLPQPPQSNGAVPVPAAQLAAPPAAPPAVPPAPPTTQPARPSQPRAPRATARETKPERLGDFTATPRVIALSLIAAWLGIVGAFIALALLRLIGLFTNLFFYQRWRTDLVSPAGNHLGPFELLVPVVGALISMGAILGGTMRSPFTGIVFILELTHDVNVLLPLLIAVVCAHLFTVLTLRRSILTEKVARRGYHLSREYATDPLEILFTREVMRTNIAALRSEMPLHDLSERLRVTNEERGQLLYPVVDDANHLIGVVTRSHLLELLRRHPPRGQPFPLAALVTADPVVAYPDEPLRTVVHRMADTGLTRFPVIERGEARRLVGMVSLRDLLDLLKARALNLDAERRRERVLPLRLAFPRRVPARKVQWLAPDASPMHLPSTRVASGQGRDRLHRWKTGAHSGYTYVVK